MDENTKRTHIDLFSGIGGFALAAKWNGLETVCFCEIDPKCRVFLERTWPGIPVHEDIKTFPAADYRGAFLLTAGVPCQPVSCAGKRRGAEDDRWLWPEALRAVSEARPDWVIFENPPGIRTLGLDGIFSELENLNYSLVVLDIPACALDSPQIRRRYWIVSRAEGKRRQRADAEGNSQTDRRPAEYAENTNISNTDEESIAVRKIEKPSIQYNEYKPERNLSDSKRQNAERPEHEESENNDQQYSDKSLCNAEGTGRRSEKNNRQRAIATIDGNSAWSNFELRDFADGASRRAKPGVCLLADGVSRGLLSALGNAIVPQVAAEIIRAIIMSEET